MMSLINKFKILTYNVGIISRDASEILKTGVKKNEIKWLKHNYHDRFFADPFLLKEDNKNYYIMVEEYLFWEEKGKIVVLIIDKDSFELIERVLLIEEKYHLSFPFYFPDKKTIIPESVAASKTVEYTIDIDSLTIKNKKNIINEGLIDGVYYDDGDNLWLFASHSQNPKEDLYLYKKVNEEFIIMNNGKPIMKDISLTRGAGAFFIRDGLLYRPVQDSKERYGYQTNIVRIDKIEDDNFLCKKVLSVNSFENPPFDETLHTFNVYDGFVIVDGSKDIIRFPMKAFYKLRKKFRNSNK